VSLDLAPHFFPPASLIAGLRLSWLRKDNNEAAGFEHHVEPAAYSLLLFAYRVNPQATQLLLPNIDTQGTGSPTSRGRDDHRDHRDV